MPQQPEHQELADALIDGQLEVKEFAERMSASGADVARTTMAVAERLLTLRAEGKVSAEQAKRMVREVYTAALLAAFARNVHGLKAMADKQLEREERAIRKHGKPLRTIAAIRDVDVAERLARKKKGEGEGS